MLHGSEMHAARSKEQHRISYPASKKMMNETELLKTTVPTPRPQAQKEKPHGKPGRSGPPGNKNASFMAFTATKPC